MQISDVLIETEGEFIPRFSDSEKYVFAYHVNITNNGDQNIQILSRFWEITDANEKVIHVKGEGLVGKKPTIIPGESFEYTSSVAIATEIGFMSGSYHGITQDGELLSFPIDLFTLQIPNKVN
ncbi:Co2+/Mg2+ efflux protein ApaG [Marinicellulosiphila megalodicopiae]|uniref:Co2+/Mg2+ efflux protein ApaG n=1 Tax=Marinicellulosiphila megalodicopiae TaxID=2724896 RepID=UPI003BB0D4D7